MNQRPADPAPGHRDSTGGHATHGGIDAPAGREREIAPYLDLVDAIVLEIDLAGRVSMINRFGRGLLGRAESELVGADWFDTCVAPEDRAEARAQLAELERVPDPGAEGRLEHRILAAGGGERRITWRFALRRDAAGAPLAIIGSGVDVSSARRAEEVQARAEKALQDIRFALDVSTIVAITDARGTITFVNDRFCEISKYTREELVGQNHRIINSGNHPPSFFKEMWATISRGKVWRDDIRNRAKDGTFYWVATTIVPFLDDSGRPYQYLAIRHEITERKLAEAALEEAVRELEGVTQRERSRAEELERARESLVEANRRLVEERAKVIQAEKLSSIGLLAAGVAHEINNPLAGVLGCMKQLRTQSMTPRRREEYFETMRDGLERIQQTVRGLLDYARQQTPRPEVVDAHEVVAAAGRLVAPALHERRLELLVDVAPGRFSLFIDRAQLLHALVNVFLNAIHASPEGQKVEVAGSVDGPSVRLTVTDHGPGIAPELLSRVCDPFFTTKPEGQGTGLGLALTLSLLEVNGGELNIRSTVGHGTTVEFIIPARNASNSDG